MPQQAEPQGQRTGLFVNPAAARRAQFQAECGARFASLALADARGNQVMKTLTGWAAIIAVPTLVTSFVGMNVGFPLGGTTAGFWVYSAIMVLAGVVLSMIPALVVFVIGQRPLREGLTAGSSK